MRRFWILIPAALAITVLALGCGSGEKTDTAKNEAAAETHADTGDKLKVPAEADLVPESPGISVESTEQVVTCARLIGVLRAKLHAPVLGECAPKCSFREGCREQIVRVLNDRADSYVVVDRQARSQNRRA